LPETPGQLSDVALDCGYFDQRISFTISARF
jgi:hypothetical protein